MTSHMQRTDRAEKSTWYGCGDHIRRVLDPIPVPSRCTCQPTRAIDGNLYPPMFGQGMPNSLAGDLNRPAATATSHGADDKTQISSNDTERRSKSWADLLSGLQAEDKVED